MLGYHENYKMAWYYWASALFFIFWLPPEVRGLVWVFIGMCVSNLICHFLTTPPTGVDT